MEGLIPLVLRAIKRQKTRRSYTCLSSGAAVFDMAELQTSSHNFLTPPPEKLGGLWEEEHKSHRRNVSMQEFPAGGIFSPEKRAEGPKLAQDMRSPSRMFACVGGGHDLCSS